MLPHAPATSASFATRLVGLFALGIYIKSMSSITYRRASGAELDRYLGDLARLRIAVFRDYPYLYDGSLDYEHDYLRTYASVPGSVVVLALDGERVVGAATGLPLISETPEVQGPFLALGYDPAQVFYFGESVLLSQYRGHGVGVRFFLEREAHARAVGPFQWTCFCAVERPADHPRRPSDHVPLDAFWSKRGYRKHPELRTHFSWKEIDEPAESEKEMVFWLKRHEVVA